MRSSTLNKNNLTKMEENKAMDEAEESGLSMKSSILAQINPIKLERGE